MKNILSILLSMCILSMYSQSVERKVTGSAGGTYAGPSASVTFTIGESVISTLYGNSHQLTQGFQQPGSFTIIDQGDLAFDAMSFSGMSLQCDDTIPYIEPIVISTCNGGYTLTHDDFFINGSCNYIIGREWNAIDACGNEAQWIQTFPFVDTTAPKLTSSETNEVYLDCDDEAGTYNPQFSDNCDQDLLVQQSISMEDNACGYVAHYTWIVTDDCGNILTFIINEHHEDTTPPAYTGNEPTEYFLACDDEMPSTNAFTDNCDAALDITSSSVQNGDDINLTWTATDNCGNSSSVIFTVHISCCTSPELVSEPEDIYISCGNVVPAFSAPVFSDPNNGELTITHTEETVAADCGYTINHTWTATNDCGLSTVAQQSVIAEDNALPYFIGGYPAVSISCGDSFPEPVLLTAGDNCDTDVGIAVSSAIVSSDDCGGYVTEITYIATDDCGNFTTASYTITVADTEEPVIDACPADISLNCGATPPAADIVTASDNCDNEVEVVMEEFYLGNAPVPGAIQQCALLTPVRPANNPCGYPADWAMSMFGLPKTHRFYYVSAGSFVKMADGSIHITATLNNVYAPANGWNVNMTFANGKTWTQWTSQTAPHSFKGDCGGEGANHTQWLYYLLQNTPGAELTGFGGYAGSSLSVVHAPANNYFGFQLGDGANNYNGVENGFGGWFSYSGQFIVNGVGYGATGNITGAGDIAFDMNCCPSYELVRQWTASDCSGNTSTCSQKIHIGTSASETNPQNLPSISSDAATTHGIAGITAYPNPANRIVIFTIETAEAGKTSLDILNIAGETVAVVYNVNAEADTQQKIEYDTDQLASGIYFYRFVNGSSTATGKLVVTH